MGVLEKRVSDKFSVEGKVASPRWRLTLTDS